MPAILLPLLNNPGKLGGLNATHYGYANDPNLDPDSAKGNPVPFTLKKVGGDSALDYDVSVKR